MTAARTKRKRCAGQSLIESALVLPLLLLLVVNVVNFGVFFYDWISIANAARTGAQYFTTGGVALGGITPPGLAAVQTLVLNDLKSLPNQTSIQVCISWSNSANVFCNQVASPAGTPPAADTPEGAPPVSYVIGAVDVSYTYQPIIPTWEFPGLGIYTTLPPTTLHRQAKMRVLQ
jgi:hypothetical protein